MADVTARWMTALCAALAGCGWFGSHDPQVSSLGTAVHAWERAQEATRAGDAAAALTAYDEAVAARPDDPLLRAWQARALVAAGELERARATLDVALAAHPAAAYARYDRAVLRARLGDAAGAADDLDTLLQAGDATPRGVVRDPDLAPYLSDPAFARLPRAALDVRCGLPDGKVWWGSEAAVTVTAVGAVDGPLEVGVTAGPGPLVLDRIVEDDVLADGGDRARVWTWSFRVAGPGEVAVSEVSVSQGPAAATAACGVISASAPDGKRADATPLSFPNPSALALGRVPPEAWRSGPRVLALVGPRHTVVAEPAARPTWSASLRRDGAVIAQLVAFPAEVRSVRVMDGRDLVWASDAL